jgi:hypothetical protein
LFGSRINPFLLGSRINRLVAPVLEGDEPELLHTGATLATYCAIVDRSPMTREFEVSAPPEYAFLSKSALLIATDRRLLVSTEADDGSAHVHFVIPYRTIKGVRPPDLHGMRRLLATRPGRRFFAVAFRQEKFASPALADLNPAVELHGDNEMIVLLLPLPAIEQLLGLLEQRSHATVLPSA